MKPKYIPEGESFLIENYNGAAPFSNFFPALAGVTGKPMWVFYTNRAQGIASFGVNNKDGSMLEFQPANKAYQCTPILGFRTFLKSTKKDSPVYEPFTGDHTGLHQVMIVRPYELEIRDQNSHEGVAVSVVYFGVPGENNAVLARRISFKNTSSQTKTFQVVDGLPRVVPWGMSDFLVKNMSRTIEAFAEVINLKGFVPFFKLKIEPHDRPDIRWLEGGFFSFGLAGGNHLTPVVDPSLIFGHDTSFSKPHGFMEKAQFSVNDQLCSNIMPSSFFSGAITLRPHETKEWCSYFGFAENLNQAHQFVARVRENGEFFSQKREEMKQIYLDLTQHFGITTGDETLNHYSRGTFMDNVLRGGFPMSFSNGGPIVHVFSRKHGDMERDYNSFQISANYYSQGNGNFRDVNQNRRNDLLINPAIGTNNVDVFFNLLQLDGFNPLVIDPTRFMVPKDILNRLELKMSERCKKDYQALISGPVLAGQIYDFIYKHSVDPLSVGKDFKDIMSSCVPHQSIQHGEGFWTDHWTYNLDHLDQYLSVFPDKKSWLLHEKNDFSFHDSDHFVRPRKDKYILTPDGKLRQYNAVGQNNQKKALIMSRQKDPNKVRTEHGTGEVYLTTLFSKLTALALVKLSSLDPFGVGIEMEADKPGWCDALNGLPGLFGSSTHEMYELRRLLKFLLEEAIPLAPNKTVELPSEIASFMTHIDSALSSDSDKDFRPVWDKLASAREEFREKTFFGFSGKTRATKVSDIKDLFVRGDVVLAKAHKKAIDPRTKIPSSYFFYEVETTDLGDGWRQFLYKLPWKQHRVVSFLEGPVHAMKLASAAEAQKLYRAVKKSDLWDKPLGLYRLNSSLEEESTELGRIRIFSRGWLENESIFLHMHYKYLLEILRSGMTDIFLSEAKTGLIPFRSPASYGRSIYENSSFLVSSSFPDKSYHGKGFAARLSGATSEFLSMVYFMAFGSQIFKAMEGGIVFSPEPRLPKEWFTEQETLAVSKNSFCLKLFGVPITYFNPSHKKTFGPGSVKPVEFEWILDGRYYQHKGRHLTPEASLALRESRLESLKIRLG